MDIWWHHQRNLFDICCSLSRQQQTKKALWPIIQANVIPGTTIYSDGWRAYRKLPSIGYPHRWIDHSKHYVDPTDRSLHTNMIEGFWGCFKRWLPSSGPYNLEQYLDLFLWFTNLKIQGINPFWRLVELVQKNNSVEVMKKALGVKPEAEGFEYIEEEAELDAAEMAQLYDPNDNIESGSETSDASSEIVNFSCPFCQKVFEEKEDVTEHVNDCDEAMDEDDVDEISSYACPFCEITFKTEDEVMVHVDTH